MAGATSQIIEKLIRRVFSDYLPRIVGSAKQYAASTTFLEESWGLRILGSITLLFGAFVVTLALIHEGNSSLQDRGASAGASALERQQDSDLLVETLANLESYQAAITVEVAGQTTLEGTIQAVLPDRYQLFITKGGGVGTLQTIMVGKVIYTRLAGNWSVTPNYLPFSPAELTIEFTSLAKARFHKLGLDTVHGVACQVFTTTNDPGGKAREYCVSPDGVLQRFVSEGDGVKTTLMFSGDGDGLQIAPPI